MHILSIYLILFVCVCAANHSNIHFPSGIIPCPWGLAKVAAISLGDSGWPMAFLDPQSGTCWIPSLVNIEKTYKKLLKMSIEIVDLPNKHGDFL